MRDNMRNSIRVSEKHGVNPMIPVCYICGEEKNEIALLGRLPNDEKAPMKGVIDKEPCDKCKEFMKQGIIFISVRNGEQGDNPYRTGGWIVVKEEAAKRMFNDDFDNNRIFFMDDETWDKIGFPRGEKIS